MPNCPQTKFRYRIKRGDGPPTIPPNDDHQSTAWADTDIYEGELYLDNASSDVYTRNGGSIITLTSGTVTGGGIITINFADSPYTAGAKQTILASAAGGSIKIDLPAAASNEDTRFTIKKLDATNNAILIDPNGAELIEGAADYTINVQAVSITIICDGSNWFII